MSAGTKLIAVKVSSVSDAASVFGSVRFIDGKRAVPLVLLPERNPCANYLVIPEGMYAIITSYGRYLSMWNPGFHWASPWVAISHLVSHQYVVYDTPVKECPTQDNVMVEIDVTVVFHILDGEENVKKFVYNLGPEGLDSMLKAFQEEAVRGMARSRPYTAIYDLMERTTSDEKEETEDEMSVLDELRSTKRSMNERLGEYGVEIYSITITNVRLPQSTASQMQETTIYTSKNRHLEKKRELDLLVINNHEERAKLTQKLQEDREQEREEHSKRVADATQLIKQVEALTEKSIAEINEEQKAATLDIRSRAEQIVATIQGEKELELSKLYSEADSEAKRLYIEQESYVQNQRAHSKLQVSRNEAQALELFANAEKVAVNGLRSKRDYESKVSRLRVLKGIAENRKMVLSGTNRDNVVAQLLASRDASAVMGLNLNGGAAGGSNNSY